jgi:hypothetical protein
MRLELNTGEIVVVDHSGPEVRVTIEGTDRSAAGSDLISVFALLLGIDEGNAGSVLEDAMRKRGANSKDYILDFRPTDRQDRG